MGVPNMQQAGGQNSILRLSGTTLRSLEATDVMPRDLRECVHEFGPQIVGCLRQAGISDAKTIRIVVNQIWLGARSEYNRQGASPDRSSPVIDRLDWLLIQNSAQISARTLLQVLYHANMVIVPVQPSPAMVEASMATVSQHNISVDKPTKHAMRLKAAIEAGARKLWPHLFGAK